MAGRPKGSYALSDWEIYELLYYRKCGWSQGKLADYYHISIRTVRRIIARERAKDAAESAVG